VGCGGEEFHAGLGQVAAVGGDGPLSLCVKTAALVRLTFARFPIRRSLASSSPEAAVSGLSLVLRPGEGGLVASVAWEGLWSDGSGERSGL